MCCLQCVLYSARSLCGGWGLAVAEDLLYPACIFLAIVHTIRMITRRVTVHAWATSHSLSRSRVIWMWTLCGLIAGLHTMFSIFPSCHKWVFGVSLKPWSLRLDSNNSRLGSAPWLCEELRITNWLQKTEGGINSPTSPSADNKDGGIFEVLFIYSWHQMSELLDVRDEHDVIITLLFLDVLVMCFAFVIVE